MSWGPVRDTLEYAGTYIQDENHSDEITLPPFSKNCRLRLGLSLPGQGTPLRLSWASTLLTKDVKPKKLDRLHMESKIPISSTIFLVQTFTFPFWAIKALLSQLQEVACSTVLPEKASANPNWSKSKTRSTNRVKSTSWTEQLSYFYDPASAPEWSTRLELSYEDLNLIWSSKQPTLDFFNPRVKWKSRNDFPSSPSPGLVKLQARLTARIIHRPISPSHLISSQRSSLMYDVPDREKNR